MINLSNMTADLWEATYDALIDAIEAAMNVEGDVPVDEAAIEAIEADLDTLSEWDGGAAEGEFIGFLGADGFIYADEADAAAGAPAPELDFEDDDMTFAEATAGTYDFTIPEWMLS